MRKFLLCFLFFVFLLCLVFQSEEANANSFYQDDPQFQINPGRADVPIHQANHKLIQQKDKNVFYRIQVKAEPTMTADLNMLEKQSHQTSLVIEKHKGLFKYLSVPIANHHDAIDQLKLVHTYRGFENSFIVIYRNGFRISADGSQSAVQYLEKEKTVNSKMAPVDKPAGSKLVYISSPIRKPLSVKSKSSVLSTATEKILGVMKLPFINYNHYTILLILFMLMLNFAFIAVLLLIHRIYIQRKENNYQRLKDLYAESLAGFVFDELTDPPVPEALLNANTRFQKNLLIQEMISVIHNIGSGAEAKMKALYYKLELQHHSIRKLNSRKWVLKIPAMHELAVFNVSEAADSVEGYIYHKNQILKHEALRCLVRLKPHNPFETLLNNADEVVRESVIRAIGEMHLTDYCEPLMISYDKENKKNQIIILDAMSKLGDPALLDFLSDIVLKNNDIEIRLRAASALINIGSLGLMRMQVLLLNQDKDIETIYNHVTAKPD